MLSLVTAFPLSPFGGPPTDCVRETQPFMDIRRALLVLRRWWPLLVAGTLIAAGAAYVVSKALPKVYDATAIVQVNPGIGTVGGGLDFNEVQASWAEANRVAQVIHTSDIAQAAIDSLNRKGQLQRPVDAGALLKNTRALPGSQLGIVTLDVRAATPQDASNLANAMTTLFIARDTQRRTAGFDKTLREINRQIAFYSADTLASQRQLDTLSRLSVLTPAQQAQGRVLEQHTAADQQQSWSLQQQALGIELRLAGAGNSLSLVQQATPPSTWVSPRTSVNTLVAAVLALLVLLGLVFLIDAFDDRPRRAADVAAALDVPLLATLDAAGAPLAMLEQPASAAADQYRALRVALVPPADGAPVLAVTGLRPGDGATTAAVNLAAAIARAGQDVALIDANLRRPALHDLLGLSGSGGLSEALRAGAEPLALLRETRLPHLRVLPAGGAPAEAIDLLGSARMREVLSALRAAGHAVVLDTAPAAHADAALTGALADVTLLVARLHDAHGAALAETAARLRQAGTRLAGVAVTLFSAPATQQAQPTADVAGPVEPAGRSGLRSAK